MAGASPCSLEVMTRVERHYDVVIVGGGPTGMAAGLYAARARRSTVLLERSVLGGQIAITGLVENYPGFPDGVQGPDLAMAFHSQAEKVGMETEYLQATKIEKDGIIFRIETDDPDVTFTAKSVIVTAGADHNKLEVPGEELLTGRGVSYCATCDAAFFKDQVCVVVGGGDAAIDEGLFVARYASKVYLVHRRDQLRATPILQERAFAEPKIEFVWDSVVEEVLGETDVRGVRIRNVKSGEERTIEAQGVFIFIGLTPNSSILRGLVDLDAGGHAIVDLWMRTKVPGLFVAGDIRAQAARQLVSAAGDGATAAIAADHYITDTFRE